MFPHHSNSSPVPKLFSQNANINNQNHSQISEKSLQIKMNHSRQSRQHKLSRMRQMNSMQSLKYEDMSFYKFFPIAEKQTNPFTILLTIFVIADNFSWRQYLPHLEILIKKFTNMLQCSKGKILQELSNKNALKTKLGGYSFQERFQTMLHLSNKQFQQHLLILIHALIAYNKRYCLLDQALLSDHLTFKHSYEKGIRQQVLWLLTRMSVSGQSFNKIIKNILMNPQNSNCLLPTLTIIANFIYQQPDHIIEQVISSPEFYNALGRGLISSNYQTQRQSVFICNNIVFKSQACCNFILSQSNLVNQIQKLNNEEVIVFKTVLQGMMSEKNVSIMNEENTS